MANFGAFKLIWPDDSVKWMRGFSCRPDLKFYITPISCHRAINGNHRNGRREKIKEIIGGNRFIA